MADLPRIGLVFGGPGPEHGVSCLSARNLFGALSQLEVEVVPVGWSPEGAFYMGPDVDSLCGSSKNPHDLTVSSSDSPCALESLNLTVAFPIAHGVGGEDGTLQGHLKTLNLPHVGAGVSACVNSWHKGTTKLLCSRAGLPVVPWCQLSRGVPFGEDFESIKLPAFVKPATSGSSIGITRVEVESDLAEAMETAWVEGPDILIEPEIIGREVECAFLMGKASGVGEIHSENFYSYDEKYINSITTSDEAAMEKSTLERIRQYTLTACHVLGIRDMARVDFFIEEKTGALFLNEVNSYPGFTDISMYPKLWIKSGFNLESLVQELLTPHLTS